MITAKNSLSFWFLLSVTLFFYSCNKNREKKEIIDPSQDIPAVIHVFDWNGNPVIQLMTKEKIIVFDIDVKKNMIYGMTANEDFYLYKLDDILDL